MIVNYRTAALTLDAVRSVLGEPEVREVLVVDNGSGDGSAGFLRAELASTPARIIESPVNAGFGAGVNLAAQDAACPLLFILNSDAVLVKGSLALLARALVDDESVGVAAPVVYEADGRTVQVDAVGPFPQPFGRWRYPDGAGARTTSPDWVSGVAMLLRRRDFLDVGGFDPDFEMYLEDVDLCRRLRARGQVARREPAAAVVHLGGRSWGSRAEKKVKFQTSKVAYFRKVGVTGARLAYPRAARQLWLAAARLGRHPVGRH